MNDDEANNTGYKYTSGFMNYNTQKENTLVVGDDFEAMKRYVEACYFDTFKNGIYYIDSPEGRWLFTGLMWNEPIDGEMDWNTIVYDARRDRDGDDGEARLYEVWNPFIRRKDKER